MIKFLNNKGIQFGLISIFSQAISFLIPLAIAKVFSPELFGQYSLALMIVMFFLVFLMTSSQTPFIISSSKEIASSKKMNKSFSVKLGFMFISIISFILILVLFNGLISRFTGLNYIEVFSLTFLFFGLLIKDFLYGFFLANDKKNKSAFVNFVYSLINIILIFSFWIFNILNIQTLFFSYFLSSIFIFLFFFRKSYFQLLFPLKFEKEIFLEIFHFTKWQIFGLTAVYLINWGDNIVLRTFTTFEEIGIYNFGYAFFAGAIGIILLINAYFLPIMSKKEKDREFLEEYFNKIRIRVFFLGGGVLLFLNFIFSLFIYLFYNPEYLGSIIVLWILFPGLIFALYYTFYMPFLNVRKKYKILQIINIIQILLNLIFGFILVPLIGFLGAAISTVIGYLVKLLSLEYYFRKSRILKLK
jgi:O-antigen/teichoic acid export membrane protein